MRRTSPRRIPESGFTLVEILVVLAILAALMGMVATMLSKAPAAKNRLVCGNNLRNLGAVLLERRLEGDLRSRPGTGWLLQLHASGDIAEGEEKVFLCPNDPAWADPPAEIAARFAALDPDRPGEGLCSYRVRDFSRAGLPGDSRRREPLVLCPHHSDGVQVLYSDASVVFLDREALGLGKDAPIRTGPGADHPVLRVFPE